MIENRVAIVSNYATDALQTTLDEFAEEGYKLVSTEMAKKQVRCRGDVPILHQRNVKEDSSG